ncbi:MAG TPA: DEAD/DEAH box helicase family protein [Pyrinomonadaceae bacterium]|nr:DEAD/DEAH box helicase family protein [Pyrinomonadaceae bacterium]
MSLHPEFPASPYAPLVPEQRWFPADEVLRDKSYDKLLPPLVAKLREEIHAWRASAYEGASSTSRALLHNWFETEHLIEEADGSLSPFRYYFAQQEAVETVIWLYEVRQARDKFDLLRFSSMNEVSPAMFDEDWPRYVLKMATGAGKTKVLSLLIAWSFFHRLYEEDSTLSRNFLVIAPNIIVLDRLRADFDGLRIFFNDPILPPNGFEGQNWRDDFQLTLHIQDDVRVMRDIGNIFLTNIHRVFLGDITEPSLDDEDLSDYFLAPFGPQPSGKTTDSKTDLGEIIREVDELAIFNDEAHHIHNPRMAWFKSIQDIHHRMLQRDGRLALQVDVTATPRHDNGAIFVQTVSDYPLVEAIHQNVVKHPVLPDAASRAKLHEHKSAIFTEKYADYLALGVEEWRKSYAEQAQLGKKAVLFVMVDDTRNCDEVGDYLRKIAPELEGDGVLIIHTKNNGEVSEAASGKNEEELRKLRKASNEIDTWQSPHKAIVSVLMLKEGWDVRNVTTIVGLRAYVSKSNILPEQTLGRGLRRMYFGTDVSETVSVMGTPAFMDFVESIQSEGVTLEYKPMGAGPKREESLMVEVDTQNEQKDIEALDTPIPKLTRRYHREFKHLDALDPASFKNQLLPLKPFTPEQTREIVFKTMLDSEIHHTIQIDGSGPADYRSVVAFFARQLLKDLRLVGGYDVLYGKVKAFMREFLFAPAPADLEDPVVLRNLSEPDAGKILYDSFKSAMNALTIQERGITHIEDRIRLRETRPFRTEHRPYLAASKSIFSKIVGEPHSGGFELSFAAFLESAADVAAFNKIYLAVGFKLDYVKADGDLSNYIPDFIVRTSDRMIWIVETKGREEIDLPQKMARLKQWCADATAAEEDGQRYDFVFVDQSGFEKHAPKTFAALTASFTEYKQ